MNWILLTDQQPPQGTPVLLKIGTQIEMGYRDGDAYYMVTEGPDELVDPVPEYWAEIE